MTFFPQTEKRAYRPRPLAERDDYELRLDLPLGHATFDWLRHKAEQDGVQVGHASQATERPIDQPLTGQVAIFSRDERRAKYGKPEIFFDAGNPYAGQTPIAIVGAGQIHLGDLKDKADEIRHYGQDQVAEEPTDWQEVYWRLCEQRARRRAGRVTFAPPKQGWHPA